MGQSGCVTFMFDKKGMLAIERTDSIDEDELTMLAIDLGAEDLYQKMKDLKSLLVQKTLIR